MGEKRETAKDLYKKVKLLILVGLAPLLFYPVVFCPFSLPYLYCSICPMKCLWGRSRWILLSVILIFNLKTGRIYCSWLCPIGTCQEFLYQLNFTGKKFNLPSTIQRIKYLFLMMVILFLFLVKKNYFFINSYVFWIIFSSVILLTFFVRRLWCKLCCPIGTITDITLKIKEKCIRKKRSNLVADYRL